MEERFIEIWNEAYNIFTDVDRSEGAQYNDMQKFLTNCVKSNELTDAEKRYMVCDIMATCDL